jgi:hypothetical protein
MTDHALEVLTTTIDVLTMIRLAVGCSTFFKAIVKHSCHLSKFLGVPCLFEDDHDPRMEPATAGRHCSIMLLDNPTFRGTWILTDE